MHGAAGELAQPGPGHFFHQHARRLGLPKQLEELGAKAHLWSAPDAVDGAAAFQGRLGGVAPPDQIGGGLHPMALGLANGAGLGRIHHHGPGSKALPAIAGRAASFKARVGAPGTVFTEKTVFAAETLRTGAVKTPCVWPRSVKTPSFWARSVKPPLPRTALGPAFWAGATAAIP